MSTKKQFDIIFPWCQISISLRIVFLMLTNTYRFSHLFQEVIIFYISKNPPGQPILIMLSNF